MGPLSARAAAPCTTHPDAEDVVWVPVDDHGDVGAVRRQAVAVARRLGMGERRTGELAIVATEAASNLCKHAGGGAVAVRVVRSGDRAGIELVAVDSGPGIDDVALAGVDGFSSAGTLGIGLGAILRLSDRADISTVPGRGTVLTARVWPASGDPAPEQDDDASPTDQVALGGPSASGAAEGDGEGGCGDGGGDVAGLTRPLSGESACGDAVAWRCLDGGRRALLLVDGLGHGELAARAADAAVRAFRDLPADEAGDPARALPRLHRALAGSRGAAAGIAVLDRAHGHLTWAGVGNVALRVVAADGRERSLSCQPGIVGAQIRTVRPVTEPLDASALVVLHSDGLTTRWSAAALPGLVSRPALSVAATLLREAGVGRDDASVLVDAGASVGRDAGAASPSRGTWADGAGASS